MKALLLSLFTVLAISAFAQTPEVTKKGSYTLTFSNNDPNLDPVVKERLISTFFKVYPELAKEYNKKTAKKVYMMIDTAYKGVAETDNAHVRISAAWMHKKPEDIDVVTHEVMHIVQDYGQTNGPGWLTEGIADYARNKFGVNNAAAKWALTDYKQGQNYDNSYRVTARFLLWIETHKRMNMVKILDKQMRKHTYVDSVWEQEAGKTLDGLWAEYIANPTL
ncbi:basic secretory protein-like protein [Mucilaginibacter agri]|uniref:Secretory protein n=1 Tax=Mucilaginibacter agri TaxID=2695265 RepID=A0A965ZHP8_9SPHI|nr:basic secretory protein-like protein [Mucilaginibacter agri]NCD71298.1 secretory protein [Mucilaginibacter agri]